MGRVGRGFTVIGAQLEDHVLSVALSAIAHVLTPATVERIAAALIATGTAPRFAYGRALRIAQGVGLRELAGFTLDETAITLGCSRRTVASDAKAGAKALAEYEGRGEVRGELPEHV